MTKCPKCGKSVTVFPSSCESKDWEKVEDAYMEMESYLFSISVPGPGKFPKHYIKLYRGTGKAEADFVKDNKKFVMEYVYTHPESGRDLLGSRLSSWWSTEREVAERYSNSSISKKKGGYIITQEVAIEDLLNGGLDKSVYDGYTSAKIFEGVLRAPIANSDTGQQDVIIRTYDTTNKVGGKTTAGYEVFFVTPDRYGKLVSVEEA